MVTHAIRAAAPPAVSGSTVNLRSDLETMFLLICSLGLGATPTVNNLGLECWFSCNAKQGQCDPFCGSGSCCRQSYAGSPLSCGYGALGCTSIHCCTAPAPPLPPDRPTPPLEPPAIPAPRAPPSPPALPPYPTCDGSWPLAFNASTDLIALHYDCSPDPDDFESIVADRTVLEAEFGTAWLRDHVVAVAGTFGTNLQYWQSSCERVLQATWVDAASATLRAGVARADEHRHAQVQTRAKAAREVLCPEPSNPVPAISLLTLCVSISGHPY